MSTLQSAIRLTESPTSVPNRPQDVEESDFRLAPRIQAALAALLDAFEYAQDLKQSIWDFAVELGCLRRLELSRADFRWMVGRGLVDHALEFTLAGDLERSFRQHRPLLFSKKTCFVLTPNGAEFARRLCGRSESGAVANGHTAIRPSWPASPTSMKPAMPSWDRDRQELRVGPIIVKQFKVPAGNQEAILAAFEEERWPPRIDDPLPPHREQSPKRRLQETIKSLNRNRKRAIIRFLGDGSGQGVRWEFCGADDALREP
jgi:hypothetical protein